MDTLYHTNHPFIKNLKSMNFFENKIGLVLYTRMYRLMQTLTIWLAEFY